MTLSQSPTQRVGYEVLSQLPKEKHPQKMLSLDKTKDVDALVNWLGAQDGVLFVEAGRTDDRADL